MLERKNVEGVCSRRQMDEASRSGKGVGSSLAAPRAWKTPEEQPRLALDAMSALINGLSGKREPCSPAWNQMQDACVARVESPACMILGPGPTDGVLTSAEALSKVLRGLDAYDSGAGSSTLASLRILKLSLPVDTTSASSLLWMLPDFAGCYLREPERMVTDAMHGAQEFSFTPEPYFDPMLTHRRRTYVELVRLLVRRGMVRFILDPKERVGLFAVRKDGGQNQWLIVDTRRSTFRLRPERGASLE